MLSDRIPIVNDVGLVTGIIVFAIDMTERIQAQEKLEKRCAELRTIVNSMAGHENRMVELKDAIRQLRGQLDSAGITPIAGDPLSSI